MTMMALIGTFTLDFEVSLPLLATVTFYGTATTYGWLLGAFDAGAVAVTALWSMAPVGTTPIGSPVIGAISDAAGPRYALALGRHPPRRHGDRPLAGSYPPHIRRSVTGQNICITFRDSERAMQGGKDLMMSSTATEAAAVAAPGRPAGSRRLTCIVFCPARPDETCPHVALRPAPRSRMGAV